MSRMKLATVWLDGCSGCHMSFLDLDEQLATVARLAEMVFGPLVDAQEFPEGVDVTLVEGAVSSQDDLRLAQVLRKRSRVVVALGDCAVTGNVPSMRNGVPVAQLLQRVHAGPSPTEAATVPRVGVPALLKRAVPLHEVIKVDLHVPGCPPRADAILYAVGELLQGRKPELATKVKFG